MNFFIYLARSGSIYKLGHTWCVSQRFSLLPQPEGPLALVHLVPALTRDEARDGERLFHDRYTPYRVLDLDLGREWYRLPREEVEAFCAVTVLRTLIPYDGSPKFHAYFCDTEWDLRRDIERLAKKKADLVEELGETHTALKRQQAQLRRLGRKKMLVQPLTYPIVPL